MTVTAYGGAFDALLGRSRTTFRGHGLKRHKAFLARLDRRIKKAQKKNGSEPLIPLLCNLSSEKLATETLPF